MPIVTGRGGGRGTRMQSHHGHLLFDRVHRHCGVRKMNDLRATRGSAARLRRSGCAEARVPSALRPPRRRQSRRTCTKPRSWQGTPHPTRPHRCLVIAWKACDCVRNTVMPTLSSVGFWSTPPGSAAAKSSVDTARQAAICASSGRARFPERSPRSSSRSRFPPPSLPRHPPRPPPRFPPRHPPPPRRESPRPPRPPALISFLTRRQTDAGVTGSYTGGRQASRAGEAHPAILPAALTAAWRLRRSRTSM
jgi:hypothetical protein